jgi:hypothetical protein
MRMMAKADLDIGLASLSETVSDCGIALLDGDSASDLFRAAVNKPRSVN